MKDNSLYSRHIQYGTDVFKSSESLVSLCSADDQQHFGGARQLVRGNASENASVVSQRAT